MRKHGFFKRALSWLLAIAMLAGLSATAFAVGTPAEVFEGRVFVSNVKTQLAPGAVEHKITTNNSTGKDQNIDFLCEVDLSGTDTIKVMACYAGYSTTDLAGDSAAIDWRMMNLPEQAKRAQAYFDAHQDLFPNYKVVGVIVGDTYNMSTGQPTSVLVMNGKTYQAPNGSWYFAIDKSGRPLVTDSMDTSNLESAVGGMGLLVKDGQNVASTGDNYVDSSFSRAAVGVTADGNVITFCTYGNSYPISCGYTWREVADYLIAQGCKDAIMLDGSGSAEWCARYEGKDSVESVSHPSDGSSRAVGSCLLIVSTAAPDGVFARANVTPSTTVYTPNSQVSFSATGSDSAGNKVDVPADAAWALDEGSADMGTMEGNVFTANDKTGDVTVNLVYNGKVVGSATITIAKPDSITFTQETVVMGRNEASDLGLQVRYQNRDVNLKDGDLSWVVEPESIGSVSGNRFTSVDTPCEGTVTVSSTYDASVTATVSVTIGKEPYKLMDFEPVEGQTLQEYYGLDENNYVVGRTNGGIAATGWLTRLFYNRGGNETARLVGAEDDYPVHSGEYALQVNYDFSNCYKPGEGNCTEGACIGPVTPTLLPDSPTAIGLWVYVPKNTPNLWLRVMLDIYDSNGNKVQNTYFDFGPQINTTFPVDGTYGGLTVCEEGTWVYCEADLTAYKGCTFYIPAGQAIRIMRTEGTADLTYTDPETGVSKTAKFAHGKYLRDGTEVAIENLKGSVYFDDMMFIYGNVNEDTDAPTVTEARFYENNDSVELKDGATLEWNTAATSHYFSVSFDDVVGASGNTPVGIDYDACYIYLDGESMNGKEGTLVDKSTNSIMTYASLSNGEHTLRVLLSDNNGNKTSKTYYFTVKNAEASLPVYSVVTDKDTVTLGDEISVTVRASDRTGLTEMTATVEVENRYANGGYTVIPAEGYTLKGDPVYKDLDSTITFTVTGDGTLTGEGEIATVTFEIARVLAQGSYFTYAVNKGITTVSGVSGDYHPGFSAAQRRLEVTAPYTVTSDLLYAGMTGGALYVRDQSQSPVASADVFYVNGEKLGTTDETGKLVLDDELLAAAGKFEVYAAKGDDISFKATVTVNSVVEESGDVLHTVVDDATTCHNLSWLSPVNGNVVLRYAAGEEGLAEAAATKVGAQVLRFGTNDQAAQINTVQLTGLTPGTTYYYQYSMDGGETWSEADSFTTAQKKDSAKLFVLGDVQAADTTNIKTILAALNEDDYDLGIQTGDLVDTPTDYKQWTDSAQLFAALGDQQMLYALGNHEDNMSDDGSLAEAIYQMENKDYYSVEYGNVYVATIRYNSQNGYKEALEWLVKDAQASSAQWKILAMHQPTYYTNSTATDNVGMDALMPSYLQEAGINVVFTGHDHSYARTAALVDGQRAESYDAEKEENVRNDGIVYYICGSSGEKSYPIDKNLPFDFRVLKGGNDDEEDTFTAIYLTVDATKEALAINTYDLVEVEGQLQPKVIDTYTMYAYPCGISGQHVFDETSEYDMTAKTLTCTICGEPFAADTVMADGTRYTGRAVCGDGQVYLFNGKVQTGWITIGEEVVHTASNGLLHDTLSFTTETCTENGSRYAYCNVCDITKSYGTNVKYHNHSYDENYHCTNTYYDENHQLHECGWTGVDINTLPVKLGFYYGYYKGNDGVRPSVTVTNGDITLIRQSTYGDYWVQYYNNVEIGVARAHLIAYNSYYGERDVFFEIRPRSVTEATAESVTDSSVKLTWEAPLGAEGYWVYQKTGSTMWTRVADVSTTEVELTGLKPSTEYSFRIRAYATVEDTPQRLDGSYNPIYQSLESPTLLTLTTLASDPANYAAVEAAKALIPADLSIYTDESVAALNAALAAVEEGLTVERQAEVDAWAAAIRAAVEALEIDSSKIPADYAAVEAAKALVPEDLSVYTEESVAALKAALDAVKEGLTADRQAEVDAWAAAIREAVFALARNDDKKPADYTAVNAALAKVPSDLSGYTEESVAALNEAISAVKAGLTSEEQAQVDAWAAAIEAALEGLKKPADYTAVNAALAKVPADLSIYTEETVAALNEAINAVKTGLTSDEQAQVDAWAAAIEAALSALEEKKPCDGSDSCPGHDFTDMPAADNWAHAGIDFCVKQGLFEGMSETTFEPDTAMSRAMLVTVLWRYEKEPAEGENTFTDVEDDAWYAKAVAWAAKNAIVDGIGGGHFDPEANVSREQLATILFRYAKTLGLDTEAKADFAGFEDGDKVSSWAADAMSWAVAEGIIAGSKDGGKLYLDPQGDATRAQVALMLMRFLQNDK